MASWLLRVVAPVAVAAVLLGGVLWLGRLARVWLNEHDRYTLAFEAIECPAPADLSRKEFLNQVQYLAEMPDQVRLLNRDTPVQLLAAFARHPWVERVERVEVGRDRIRMALTFRQPVLAVAYDGGEPDLVVRAVDRHAVLLPASANRADLPSLQGEAAAPTGAVGAPWGDPAVAAAARLAAVLQPHQPRLQLQKIEVEAGGDVWLILARGRVRWGVPPEATSDNDPATAERLARLLKTSDLER